MSQAAMTSSAQRARGAGNASLVRLAWRNLGRHRRRTALLIVVVAYATMTTIFFWGLNDGFLNSVLQGNARYLAASVLVETSAYQSDPDPEHALPALDLARLGAVPGVQAAAPRLEFPALVRSPYQAEAVQARGVDPTLEARVSAIPAAIHQGRILERPGEVVLGAGLAARLDLRLGERAVVDASSANGPQAAGLKVVGLVRSGIGGVDDHTVLVSLDDARRLSGVTTATGVALAVARGQEKSVARAVQAVLPDGVRAYDLGQLLGGLSQVITTKQGSIFLIALLFSIFAALAVSSTVLVSVLERTREFGVIGAVGMDPGQLARMVTLEAVIATGMGWAVGMVLGYGLNAAFATWNVLGPLFSSYGSFQSLGLSGEIYTSTNLIYGLDAALTIALAAVFATLIPARRVRNLKPADALRAE